MFLCFWAFSEKMGIEEIAQAAVLKEQENSVANAVKISSNSIKDVKAILLSSAQCLAAAALERIDELNGKVRIHSQEEFQSVTESHYRVLLNQYLKQVGLVPVQYS